MIAKGFDRLAPYYDRLARGVFGQSIGRVQQQLLARLPQFVSGSPRVLIIGGGTGWVLPVLFKACPGARVVYVEASQQMLSLSRRQVAEVNRTQVEFVLGTETAVSLQEEFDAVVTFFFLDLFDRGRQQQLADRFSAVLHENGVWLWADFQLGTGIRRIWQWSLLQLMKFFFLLCCGLTNSRLPLVSDLERRGFRKAYTCSFFGKMIHGVVFTRSSGWIAG